MDDQRLNITDIRQQAEQLHGVNEGTSGFVSALDAECKQRSGSFGQIFLRELVVRAGRQVGMVYPCDGRVLLEMLGDRQSIFRVAL